MQCIQITEDTKLRDISDRVGSRNVEHMLAINDIRRCVNIGKSFIDKCEKITRDPNIQVYAPRKMALLNTLTTDSDIFEAACMLSDPEWKILSHLNTLPNYLRVPDGMKIPDAVDIIGNGVPVGKLVYENIMNQLKPFGENDYGRISDLSIFNEVNNSMHHRIVDWSEHNSYELLNEFRIPWGEVTLYSSLSDDSIDFPVYPEELADGRSANYTTMPDMIYQYEPWYVYESSGPRTTSLVFKMHRHLWTGDHSDGKANELIRFCEANCYPKYNGSAVNTSTVTLYISGHNFITGILTKCSVNWYGPLADDGWYLAFDLTLDFTEVSKKALNYQSVKTIPLIG